MFAFFIKLHIKNGILKKFKNILFSNGVGGNGSVFRGVFTTVKKQVFDAEFGLTFHFVYSPKETILIIFVATVANQATKQLEHFSDTGCHIFGEGLVFKLRRMKTFLLG